MQLKPANTTRDTSVCFQTRASTISNANIPLLSYQRVLYLLLSSVAYFTCRLYSLLFTGVYSASYLALFSHPPFPDEFIRSQRYTTLFIKSSYSFEKCFASLQLFLSSNSQQNYLLENNLLQQKILKNYNLPYNVATRDVERKQRFF